MKIPPFGYAALGAVVALGIVGWVRPNDDTVRASKFELVDAEGRVRMSAGVDAEGDTTLLLLDKEGRERALLFESPGGTGLYVKDEEGHVRLGTALFPHGGGYAIHEPEGGSAVFVSFDGSARLSIYDREGKVTNNWPQAKP